jgi:hypothetical protein
MDFPNREINSANFNENDLELFAELEQEVVNLSDDVCFHAVHADLMINILVKPLNYSVLHFADSLQISEVLLKTVAVGGQVTNAVVIANVILPRQRFQQRLEPNDRTWFNRTHQRIKRKTDFSTVLSANRSDWNRV